jgi:hypothetical protein
VRFSRDTSTPPAAVAAQLLREVAAIRADVQQLGVQVTELRDLLRSFDD